MSIFIWRIRTPFTLFKCYNLSMITKELLDFLSKEKATGRTNEEIKSVLVQNGWLASDVEEGFQALEVPTPAPVPSSSQRPFVNPAAPQVVTMPKHGRRALLFLILLFVFGGSASAYYFRDNIKTWPVIREFFPMEAKLCLTVIAHARNPKTGEVETFASPCDVPKGWEQVSPESIPAPGTNTNLNTDATIEPFVNYEINGVKSDGGDKVIQVKQGEPVNISWNSNGEYCEGYERSLSSSWNGRKAASGSESVTGLIAGKNVIVLSCYSSKYKKTADAPLYAKDDRLAVEVFLILD